MIELQALLAAVAEDPHDHVRKLIAADKAEEDGDSYLAECLQWCKKKKIVPNPPVFPGPWNHHCWFLGSWKGIGGSFLNEVLFTRLGKKYMHGWLCNIAQYKKPSTAYADLYKAWAKAREDGVIDGLGRQTAKGRRETRKLSGR